jgi:hypothetical protein
VSFDFLMFTNYTAVLDFPPKDTLRYGNYFRPVSDNAEILNIHGEFSGKVNDKISFMASGNYYRYSLDKNDFAYNIPQWDARLNIKYNLVNKIFAGVEFQATGLRKELITTEHFDLFPSVFTNYTSTFVKKTIDIPTHFNLNISAEYRYTKILSFWLKLNNISYDKNYEWAYYPSMRFLGLIGFTYSL